MVEDMSTFTNPVHRGYFGDPFVLSVGDLFFAYGTGGAPGGRPFEVLQSPDLVSWESLGGSLDPLNEEWATDNGDPRTPPPATPQARSPPRAGRAPRPRHRVER